VARSDFEARLYRIEKMLTVALRKRSRQNERLGQLEQSVSLIGAIGGMADVAPACLGTINIVTTDTCSASLTTAGGASVTLKNAAAATVGSSTSGQLTVASLPMGVYTATSTTIAGYAVTPTPTSVTLTLCGSSLTINLTRDRTAGSTFSHLVTVQSGCPLVGATVSIACSGGATYSGTTNSAGQFSSGPLTFTPPNMGSNVITISKTNYTTFVSGIDGAAAQGMSCGGTSGTVFNYTANTFASTPLWPSPSPCDVPPAATITLTIANLGGAGQPWIHPGTYSLAYVAGSSSGYVSACLGTGGNRWRYSYSGATPPNCSSMSGGGLTETSFQFLSGSAGNCTIVAGAPPLDVSVGFGTVSLADGCITTINLNYSDTAKSASIAP
jgi:hypothetical protein